jgi:hypothetical protein
MMMYSSPPTRVALLAHARSDRERPTKPAVASDADERNCLREMPLIG